MARSNMLSEEGLDLMMCLRMSWVVESFAVKENTRIKVASGMPAKDALMPKSVKSLEEL